MSRMSDRQERGGLLLPVEMLERLFLLLTPLDLGRVVQVCRRWREVGDTPGLWLSHCPSLDPVSLASLPCEAGTRGLRGPVVREVSLELLQPVLRLTRLTKLCLWGGDLSPVRPQTLVEAITGVREARLVRYTGAKNVKRIALTKL